MNRNVGISAGVVAMLAMVFHVASPTDGNKGGEKNHASEAAGPSKQKDSEGGSKPAFEIHSTIEGPWLAGQAFYGAADADVLSRLSRKLSQKLAGNIENPKSLLDCAASPDCAGILKETFGVPSPKDTEFLLATIPDPLRTRLALFTDASIQAIQKGAAAAGWDFASQWLPWNDHADTAEKDPSARREQRALVREQAAQPGLLVFRRSVSAKAFQPGVLFVFLVGETPTQGINKVQFRLARAYSRLLGEGRRARILSPSFSGSFSSLADLIRQERIDCEGCGLAYDVRSGNATNADAAAAFRLRALHPTDTFHGENENSTSQSRNLCRVLGHLGIDAEHAALLVEDGTAFARGYLYRRRSSKEDACPNEIPVFRFPRDIAHLRNVYRESIAASQTGKAPAPDVDFSLKDTESGEDSVPIYSNAQSPVEQNAVLSAIMREIEQRGIRLVEIQATSTLDTLFLARMLHRQCPDTRALIPYPDRIFTQTAPGDDLTGTLALSTYPLDFAAARWAGDDPNLITHTDNNSAGEYNAAVTLLHAPDRVSGFGWAGPDTKLRHPAAWLLSMDRTGFAPVDVFPNSNEDRWFEDIEGKPLQGSLPAPSRAWAMVAGFLAALQLAVVGWSLVLRKNTRAAAAACLAPEMVLDGTLKSGFAPHREDRSRLLYLFGFLLILAGMQYVLFAPLDREAALASPLLSGLCAAAFCLTVYLAGSIFFTGLTSAPYFVAACCIAIGWAAGLTVWAYLCHGSSFGFGNALPRHMLFSLRSLHLQPGSSPPLPILASLLALLAFSATQMYRLFLACNQQPKLFRWGLNMPLGARLQEAYGDFNEHARALLGIPITRSTRAGLAFAAGCALLPAAVIFFACRGWDVLSSVEGPWFDVLSICLQFLVLVAIVFAGWQILDLSGHLNSLLICLQTMPLSGAFRRLDVCGGGKPIWVQRFKLQSLDIPIRGALILHDFSLACAKRWLGPVTASQAEEWRSGYREGLTRLLAPSAGKTRAQLRAEYGALRQLKADTARELATRVVFPEWGARRLLDAGCDADRERDAKLPVNDPAEPYDLAQNFVALHYSSYLTYCLRHIQNLLGFLSVGFLLLVVAMNSLNLQAPRLVGRFLMLLAVVVGALLWRCLARFERDPILSRIAGTTAGELNGEFYLRLIGYGALPVIGILAAQFPSISNFLLSWVEPTLESLH